MKQTRRMRDPRTGELVPRFVGDTKFCPGCCQYRPLDDFALYMVNMKYRASMADEYHARMSRCRSCMKIVGTTKSAKASEETRRKVAERNARSSTPLPFRSCLMCFKFPCFKGQENVTDYTAFARYGCYHYDDGQRPAGEPAGTVAEE